MFSDPKRAASTAPGPEIIGPAEMVLPCPKLAPSLAFFTERLGFRIETIFPAEDPQVATLFGHGLRIRLEPRPGDPGVLRLKVAEPSWAGIMEAPNGTRIELCADKGLVVPPAAPKFLVVRADEGPAPGEGRAGMVYRDLIPGRLGERFIASHITIPEGGPVADWVHYHKVRFQMIFCRRGWVRVVYEDQGPDFVLKAGDCVLQPPEIRHRVLESSAGLEVVEIGCPALHETWADHDLQLPTGALRPERPFEGQRFLRHRAETAPWRPDAATGFERQDTGMAAATQGFADVYVLRTAKGDAARLPPPSGDLLFGFVLEGRADLECEGRYGLGPADAFVIPPNQSWGLMDCSSDFTLLQVISPAL
jgi:quercetin dioxygenase-like cupin family protein